MRSLFHDALTVEPLDLGAALLRGFARGETAALEKEIERIAEAAPFRHMVTPGGFAMSVAMTNCGGRGWITDRKGYRYSAVDPDNGKAWPAMPDMFRDLARRAAEAAGFTAFAPDSCLINRYVPGAKMSLHQDKDETDFAAPIVSVSLGLQGTFLWGGARRSDKPRRFRLEPGDVVACGGPSRLYFHGVDTVAQGDTPCRYNLTFRKTK
ncbi:MAG: DNA oxidative demethylase AlkB [Stellaceae bacterium]